MDSQVLAAPLVRARSRRSTLIIALVAAAVGATAAIALLTGGSPDQSKHATELHGPGFTLAYPAGWSAVPAERLAAAPGQPAAIVRRADGKGAVIVRRKAAPRDQSLRALTRDLSRGLDRRFPDFRFVSSRVTRLRGGNAFLYTFVRTRQKTAQSIALARVDQAHFTLDAVAATGDQRAAREVAAIVRSFGR